MYNINMVEVFKTVLRMLHTKQKGSAILFPCEDCELGIYLDRDYGFCMYNATPENYRPVENKEYDLMNVLFERRSCTYPYRQCWGTLGSFVLTQPRIIKALYDSSDLLFVVGIKKLLEVLRNNFMGITFHGNYVGCTIDNNYFRIYLCPETHELIGIISDGKKFINQVLNVCLPTSVLAHLTYVTNWLFDRSDSKNDAFNCAFIPFAPTPEEIRFTCGVELSGLFPSCGIKSVDILKLICQHSAESTDGIICHFDDVGDIHTDGKRIWENRGIPLSPRDFMSVNGKVAYAIIAHYAWNKPWGIVMTPEPHIDEVDSVYMWLEVGLDTDARVIVKQTVSRDTTRLQIPLQQSKGLSERAWWRVMNRSDALSVIANACETIEPGLYVKIEDALEIELRK